MRFGTVAPVILCGHCQDTLWFGMWLGAVALQGYSGVFCDWALQGYSAVGHARDTPQLDNYSAAEHCAEGEENMD